MLQHQKPFSDAYLGFPASCTGDRKARSSSLTDTRSVAESVVPGMFFSLPFLSLKTAIDLGLKRLYSLSGYV